jgi:hypothetical protein
MPQDNPRSDTQRTENIRGESARAERARGDRPSVASVMSAPLGDMGARSVAAGFRAQQRMLDVLSDIGQEWFTRATAEAELALRLPNKLTTARSVPDAFSAYQEWFDEWVSMFGEDTRRLFSDSRKIVDTGVRCFAEAAPAETN